MCGTAAAPVATTSRVNRRTCTPHRLPGKSRNSSRRRTWNAAEHRSKRARMPSVSTGAGMAPSVVTIEDARLCEPREAFLDGAGRGLAHAFDIVEVVDRGTHDLLQVAEAFDDLVDDGVG